MSRVRSPSRAVVLIAILALGSWAVVSASGCSDESATPLAPDATGAESGVGDAGDASIDARLTTNDASADATNDGSPAAVHETFCTSYEQAVADYYVRCGMVEAGNVASLKKVVGAECAYRTSLIQSGALNLDVAATTCVGSLATADCSGATFPIAPVLPVCAALGVAPKPAAVGQPCTQFSGCQGSTLCPGQNGVSCGVCFAGGQVGAACPCDPATSLCASVDGGMMCVAGRTLNQTCTGAIASDQPCLDSFWCKGDDGGGTGTCTVRPSEGTSCSDCYLGGCCDQSVLRCRGTTRANALCVRDHAGGEACDPGRPCAAGLYCSGAGTCMRKAVDGTPCGQPIECASNQCNSGTCGFPKLLVGQPCTVTVQSSPLGQIAVTACVTGAYCRLNGTFLSSQYNSPQGGTCQLLVAAGGACKSVGQSRDGCAAGTCRAGACTSTPGIAGEACSDNLTCDQSLYCSASKRCTAPKPAGSLCASAACAGTACTPMFECQTGLTCFNRQCTALPGLGDSCTPGGAPCPNGITCSPQGGDAGARCQEVVGLGEACGSNGKACAAHSRCTNNLCAPGLPAGSTAARAEDCFSMVAVPNGSGGFTCVEDCQL